MSWENPLPYISNDQNKRLVWQFSEPVNPINYSFAFLEYKHVPDIPPCSG